MDVRTAYALCHAHPSAHVLWLRGWFIPSIRGLGAIDGVLFDGPQAVPLTTVNRWDVNGNWRMYGALFVHIRTHSSFGPRRLTLHGRLTCVTASFSTDRDPFPPPARTTRSTPAQVARDGSVSTSATSGGLRLTITVPRRSYPRDALAPMKVSMRNVSSHAIGYLRLGVAAPGYAVPQAEVLDASGRVVFPPAMPYFPPLPGPAPFVQRLDPGQTVAQTQYVVMRGARIRASQAFTLQAQPNPSVRRPLSVLRTRPITVALTSEPAPRISLYASGSDLRADIMPPPGVTGRPLRLSYTDCGFPTYDYTETWTASGTHITPGCGPVQEWHLRVAWVNHPVAALDYMPNTPTTAPTATASPTATPTPTAPTSAQFAEILAQANRAMAAVHTLHAAGLHEVIDSSNQPPLTIRAGCRSSDGAGLPITLQTIRYGGYHGPRTDDGYLIDGPVIPQPGRITRTWWRAPVTNERWRVVDVRKQWRVSDGVSEPAFGPNPAYTNQTCPDLIRLTYLAAPLPYVSAPSRVLGMTMLNGRLVWHLREQQGFKLDLFVDAGSYRLLRLRLWDHGGPNNRWQVRFDYSGFNEPVRITLPLTHAEARISTNV